ncbi:hypothetical protein C4588_00355 [Candidatus Parcubacteria bacterium]|nr:MAG: hypothetical protein C4588_00355 [Candidatus Parcubacteria bacterium]
MGFLDYTGNTTGKASLLDKIKVMLSEIYTTYVAEIEAARDGETDLLAKINVIKAAISSAAGGTYSLVSAADTTNGYLNDKITSTGGTLTKTIASPGGNEKLNLEITRFGVTTTSSAVDITLTSASTLTQQITMTAADKFVIMPAATGLLESEEWNFFNAGNLRFGIKDSTGVFVGSIDAQSFGRLKLIDNSTAAGTWEAIDGADLIMARLKTVCNAMTSTWVTSCKMTSTTVFAAWTGTDGDGFCAILTWVPGTPAITVSSLLEFDTTNAQQISCCRMTDTVAIVSYMGAESDGFIAAITYNGTDTLTLTDTHEFIDADTVSGTQVVPIHADASTGKIGLVYVKADTYLYGQVLNWTGTEITANTAETLINNDSAVTYPSLDILSGAVGAASMIVSLTTSASIVVQMIRWDGTTIIPTPRITVLYPAYRSSIVAVNSSYALVCSAQTAGGPAVPFDHTAIIVYWSGTALSMKKTISLGVNAAHYQMFPRDAFLLDSSTVCLFAKVLGSNQADIFKIKVVGNTTPANCVLKLDSKIYLGFTGSYHSFSGLDGAGAIAVYSDATNSSYLSAERIDIA